MIYISKGIVCKGSTENMVMLRHGENQVTLHGRQAALWLDGRLGIATVSDKLGQTYVRNLQRMGLMEFEVENSAESRYWLLTKCLFCPSVKYGFKKLTQVEQDIMIWLKKAGLHLSTSELIYLLDRNIRPSAALLHKFNRQALVEIIYISNHVQESALDAQMLHADSRDLVVKALLDLLKQKRLVIL